MNFQDLLLKHLFKRQNTKMKKRIVIKPREEVNPIDFFDFTSAYLVINLLFKDYKHEILKAPEASEKKLKEVFHEVFHKMLTLLLVSKEFQKATQFLTGNYLTKKGVLYNDPCVKKYLDLKKINTPLKLLFIYYKSKITSPPPETFILREPSIDNFSGLEKFMLKENQSELPHLDTRNFFNIVCKKGLLLHFHIAVTIYDNLLNKQHKEDAEAYKRILFTWADDIISNFSCNPYNTPLAPVTIFLNTLLAQPNQETLEVAPYFIKYCLKLGTSATQDTYLDNKDNLLHLLAKIAFKAHKGKIHLNNSSEKRIKPSKSDWNVLNQLLDLFSKAGVDPTELNDENKKPSDYLEEKKNKRYTTFRKKFMALTSKQVEDVDSNDQNAKISISHISPIQPL